MRLLRIVTRHGAAGGRLRFCSGLCRCGDFGHAHAPPASRRNVFYPLLVFSRTVPLIVLAPLFILWFGFGILPKVLIVVLVCFFPLAINILEGLDGMERDLIDLLRTMVAGPLQILLFTKLPAALGQLFSGLKIAATYCVIGAVIYVTLISLLLLGR